MEDDTLKVDMVKVYKQAKKDTKQQSESLKVNMVDVYEKAKKD